MVPVVVAGGHRAGLTASRASDKAGDAARMGTEIPSKREGSRSGFGVESLSLPRGRKAEPIAPEASSQRWKVTRLSDGTRRDSVSGSISETRMQHLALDAAWTSR